MAMNINGSAYGEEHDWIDVIDPYNAQKIGSVPEMTEADVDRAVETARREFISWAAWSQYDRSAALERFIGTCSKYADELSQLLSRETGKPLAEAMGEIGALGAITKAYCERANHMYGNSLPRGSDQTGGLHDVVFTRKEPIGVFACVLPFNFPVAMFAHKAVPALVVGNTVVIKPPTDCPLTILKLAEYLIESGVPEGAAQIVTGHGAGAAGDYLAGHPGLSAVSMTGSQEVGTRIYQRAAANLARVFLELGANDAFIVLKDADLDLAVKEALESRLLYAGQVCCGSKRFIVDRHCVDPFIEKLSAALDKVRMGDPRDPETTMGCLISEKAAVKVEEQVDYTVSQGAVCLRGGHRSGAFYEPTILTGITKDMDVAGNMEIFGPVFSIIPVDGPDDAVAIANACDYGLSGAVFGGTTKEVFDVAARLQTTTVVINGGSDYRTPELAFGGSKKSGIGREGVSRTLDEMTQEKNYVLKNIW